MRSIYFLYCHTADEYFKIGLTQQLCSFAMTELRARPAELLGTSTPCTKSKCSSNKNPKYL